MRYNLSFALLLATILALAATCKSSVSKQVIKLPPELFKSDFYKKIIAKQVVTTSASSALPNSDYTLWYVRYQRNGAESAHDKADMEDGYIFVLDNKKTVQEVLSQSINTELGADKKFDQSFCGGLGSLDTEMFMPDQNGVKVEQFYAPGAERSTCTCRLVWDSSTKKIIITDKKQETNVQN